MTLAELKHTKPGQYTHLTFPTTEAIIKYIEDRIIKPQNKVFITGTPAAGKTTLAHLLRKDGVQILNGDKFGAVKNGKWTIDFKAMPKNWHVLEGTSQNLHDLPPIIPIDKLLMVVILIPSLKAFKEAMVKRIEHETHDFIAEFKRMSKFDGPELKRYVDLNVEVLFKELSSHVHDELEVEVLLLDNPYNKSLLSTHGRSKYTEKL